jgi:hypothetical protein
LDGALTAPIKQVQFDILRMEMPRPVWRVGPLWSSGAETLAAKAELNFEPQRHGFSRALSKLLSLNITNSDQSSLP